MCQISFCINSEKGSTLGGNNLRVNPFSEGTRWSGKQIGIHKMLSPLTE